MRSRPGIPRPRFLVYALTEPDMVTIRYVGRSATGLARPREHQWSCRRERTHKAAWIRSLRRVGLTYGIQVLEVCPDAASSVDAEIVWIANGRRLGWDLTNHTDGGEGTTQKKLELPDGEIVRRYTAGESELAIAASLGVNRWTVTRRLLEYGVARRGRSDANRTRMERMSPDSRRALVGPAHAARRANARARRSD